MDAAQLEIFEEIKGLTGKKFCDVLPTGEGFTAQLASGSEEKVYLDKSSDYNFGVLFLGKSKAHRKLINEMCDICNSVGQIFNKSEKWEIIKIRISTTPQLIGKDEQGYYIYSAVVDIDYHENK